MKACAAGLLLIAILAMANVVSAGVYLALWPTAAEIFSDETYAVAAAFVIGILAVASALLFLLGALYCLPRWLAERS